MTDTPQDIRPDAADPVNEAFAQLAEPHHLLAESLLLIRSAQDVGREIDPAGDDPIESPRAAQHRRLVDEAAVLAQVAKIASEMAPGSVVFPLDDDTLDGPDEGVADTTPRRTFMPQPVQGVRFTATLVGHHVGRVAGREWLYTIDAGFLDITDADEGDGPRYVLTGRVVSATPDHALCVTDGGMSVTLPRALIVESPDE